MDDLESRTPRHATPPTPYHCHPHPVGNNNGRNGNIYLYFEIIFLWNPSLSLVIPSRQRHTNAYDVLSYTRPLIIRFAICSVLSFMAVISLSSALSIHHTMNLPSLPSEVLNLAASYPSWQFLPLHTITPPWSSKPYHPTTTTLPPITSLQRQHHYRETACKSSNTFCL